MTKAKASAWKPKITLPRMKESFSNDTYSVMMGSEDIGAYCSTNNRAEVFAGLKATQAEYRSIELAVREKIKARFEKNPRIFWV